MRPLKTLGIPTASPLLQRPAGRSALFITQRSRRPQCSAIRVSRFRNTGHLARNLSVSATSQSEHTPSSRPTFSYRIGASFSGKGRRFNPRSDVFGSKVPALNDSSQEIFTGRPNSGQDAFFVCAADDSSNVAFGVADGVGGWADQGIDSADFSHGLCAGMGKVARELHFGEKKDLLPQYILSNAYHEIVMEGKIKGGGSTACVAVGDQEGSLKVAK